MIKKIIEKVVMRLYVRQLKEITKLSDEEEVKFYRFNNPEHVEKLLKKILTTQTVRFFSDESKLTKGAGMILQIMLNAHKQSLYLYDKHKDNPDKVIQDWRKYKRTNRVD